MSVVTNVVLHLGLKDAHQVLPVVQERLVKAEIGELGDLTENWTNVAERGRRWGGTKHPELRLYGAAYNYLDLQAFMGLLLSASWHEPELVQLFVSEQEEFKLTVYEIVDGQWQALIRPGG